jgi:hypothetical protein
MHRARNNRIAFQYIGAILTCVGLPGIAASQSATVTDPPGFHLLLRSEGGKTNYKLGDAINLEVSCYSDLPERYTSPCVQDTDPWLRDADVIALDPKSKLALDPVETRWITRTLCPSVQYVNDDTPGEAGNVRLPVVGREVHWRMVTLSEHYPMSGGRFRIRIATRGAMLPESQVFTASSSSVEISVEDDRMSRLATLREAMQASKALDPFSAPATAYAAEYGKVEYFPDLEVLHWLISEDGYDINYVGRKPNRAAIAKFLHEYLDTKVGNNISLKENVEAVLALELAAGSPKLYARAVAFQGPLGKPSRKDLRELRGWLLPRYRRLMLEIAQSMVTIHKQAPGSYEDDNLEFKAENLVSLNVPGCSNTQDFLSESELGHFMRDAGLSPTFISEQIAEMRKTRMQLTKAE